MKLSYRYPRDFVWGVAASALQIEGGAAGDGRGESVWDRFARRRGAIAGGDAPASACDHYRRYPADIELMRRLGLRHYRLSVSWSRIFPSGRGAPNPLGLDFYDRLIDRLLERGITPWVTLYHWELPQALEDEGGWRVRTTVDAFGAYADAVVLRLRDRVKRWITLNEIPCFIGLGYETGVHAPGAKEPPAVVAQAYHHALLAHGHAVRAVREHGGRGARVGLTQNTDVPVPVIETPENAAAAQRAFARRNRHLLAPVFHGAYPDDYLRDLKSSRPRVRRGDLDFISQPTDFLGLNIYSGFFARAAGRGLEQIPAPRDYPCGALPWLRVVPQSIYWAVRHSANLYRPPALYITEHGACFEDVPDRAGAVADLHRREFLREYLISLHRAVDEGYPAKGYFLWSLLDNFEWAEGYRKRFGIVHVDFGTQKRTPKLSAHWYGAVARLNRVV
ncbi:MAG TPA: GH1 family beta-glucosidase [Opitutaceae bacterium]|jgi:beta-glucosidase|nr:GH1 family beta-glucosidase [Opitutaceae bacterium]